MSAVREKKKTYLSTFCNLNEERKLPYIETKIFLKTFDLDVMLLVPYFVRLHNCNITQQNLQTVLEENEEDTEEMVPLKKGPF